MTLGAVSKDEVRGLREASCDFEGMLSANDCVLA